MRTIQSPLCKCNNCGNIWLDKNPQVNQKVFEVDECCPSLKLFTDKEVSPEEFYYGCPWCITDGFLIDFEGDIEIIWNGSEIKIVEKQ